MRSMGGYDGAKVIGEQQVTLLKGKRLIHGKVAQIEENIAHRGVLPIHNPNALPIVDEVAGEQVIVAWARRVKWPDSLLNLLHEREGVRECRGKGDAVCKGQFVIVAYRLK